MKNLFVLAFPDGVQKRTFRLLIQCSPKWLLLLLPVLFSPLYAGFTLFKDSWGDIITVTDMTPAGREILPPTPEKPVYFRGRTLGCKLGGGIPGDKEPDLTELTDYVTKVLAQQGYVGARPGVNDPELYMVLQWGYLRPDYSNELLWFLGYDPDNDIASSGTIGMLGPEVFRRNMRSRSIQTILDYSKQPLYAIVITAFDYESVSTPKPIVYWQTRIALPARGKSMASALPVMAASAGPSIGRETEKPIILDADTNVEIGELEIIGYGGQDASEDAGQKD